MNLPSLNEIEFSLYAKQYEYQRKVSSLMTKLKNGIDETCYVSFSAGKDSSVLAHACHAINPSIPILMVDPGCPTHWTSTERDTWLDYAKFNGWNLIRFEWDKWKKEWNETDIKKYQKNVHNEMFAKLDSYAKLNGLTTRIVGIRAEESKGRSISVKYFGERHRNKDGTERWFPIAWWKTHDVWAYIVSSKMPYLEIYRVKGPGARNGLIGKNDLNNGRLVYLRKYFPEAYMEAKRLLSREDMSCQ